MARSEAFRPGEQPFENDRDLHINRDTTSGPVRWFAPTQATFSYAGSSGGSSNQQSYGTLSQQQQQNDHSAGEQIDGQHRRSNVDYQWTSRNSRKGRHALQVGERSLAHDIDYATPEPTNGLAPTLKGIWRMVTRFRFNDLSYLTAVAFVSGCTLLVINAFISVLPKLNSDILVPTEATIAQAVLTMIGCTLFFTSSLLSYLEAINASKEGCFGWSAEQTAPPTSSNNEGLEICMTTRLVEDDSFDDHYCSRSQKTGQDKSSRGGDQGSELASEGGKWSGLRMFPTVHELRTSYLYDLGFIACSTLFTSSIIYWTTALASLIITILGIQTAPWIRVLQLLAALGFAVASAIFALETQDSWLFPAPGVLGWHVGFWNFVGSCGFAMFAAFTLAADTGAQSSSSIHYFWGCWGFLIGSTIQWYESLDKHPVERKADST